MAQNAFVEKPVVRYTRTDFTALRAKLNHLPLTLIARQYYSEDLLDELNCATPEALNKRLTGLCTQLVARLQTKNPALAGILETSVKSNRWSKSAIEYLVASADSDMTGATLDDSLSMWFKPRVVSALAMEKIHTLSDLKNHIERLGEHWYRPVPRIGPRKAKAIEKWFLKTPGLGALAIKPDEPTSHLVPVTSVEVLVPLERIGSLPGGILSERGINRCESFCLVSARNDLDAVRAYLYKYRGQEKTLTAYRKEIERFLLWCSLERKVQLSSVLTDDCEAYKDFLANVPQHWCGPWAPRHSPRWKPFNGKLAASSQRYAIQVIRACFEWLVKVRYLAGNPWVTVANPAVTQREDAIEVEKALPWELWDELSKEGGLLDWASSLSPPISGELISPKDPRVFAVQARLARAAILLMGYSGLRREEACLAARVNFKPVPGKGIWALKALGKRNKWRTVYVPPRVADAIKAHWADRGHDFDYLERPHALLSPVVIANTKASQEKHLVEVAGTPRLSGEPFTPSGLYKVVVKLLKSLSQDESLALSEEQRTLLRQAAPHALRHTFGTHAAAKKMPIDVLQKLMGHASIQTTSIYVQAERERTIEEARKIFEV